MTARRWTYLGLALAGLLISAYLTYVDASAGSVLVCPQAGWIDCARVLTSPQASWFHVPVAAWGLGWFVVLLALAAAGWRSSVRRWTGPAALGWSALGVVVVLYLLHVELGVIGRICLWCTAVHAIVLALFLFQVFEGAP